MKYKSPMTSEIIINSKEDAYRVITHFCDYCKKGVIEQYHCSGRDSAICGAIQEQIVTDWSNRLPFVPELSTLIDTIRDSKRGDN